MYKYLIAALVIAAGCDSTRRDLTYCNAKYDQCDKGFTCNLTTELCEPEVFDAPVERIEPSDVVSPLDATPGEVAADTRDAPVIDVTPGEVAPIDGDKADAPIGVDATLPDTRVPDAAGTCSGDSDCTGAGTTVCVNFRCVACRTNTQCGGATPFCSATNTCVSCASAPGDAGVCSGNTPLCDRGSGRCVECTQNNECSANASKSFCVANQCQGCNVPGASASTGNADGGVADGGSSIDAGVVGPCLGATPICASSGSLAGQCVQCLSSADCSGSKPICDGSNICVACATDKQCADKGGGPGVCMSHQDGRCALESETIYVKNPSSCTTGDGTSERPFCSTQDGIGAVLSSKRVLVLRGPAADVLTPISATPGGSQVTIIGQNGATINGGGATGVFITAGDIYIRGLTVAGGNKVGIEVQSGATLRLNRAIVKRNVGGGLLVQSGASFDVGNCVFDENGPREFGAVRFGGVYLGGAAPASKPHSLRFNTVVNNLDTGVVCAESNQSISGMLMLDNVSGAYLNCAVALKTVKVGTNEILLGADSKWDSPGTGSDISDPRFLASPSPPYHLSANSPCKDFITDLSVPHPADDIDGDARPRGAGLDCGADEY